VTEDKAEMVVTPWEVRGEIDYDKLIEQFGVQPMTPSIPERIAKQAGFVHLQLRRGIYLSHRDVDTSR
jgi:tryptophanyl-tRNA synthetase